MDLSKATWRKSSHSAPNGGNCVEVTAWNKSSYSASNGGDCVEVAPWRKSSRSGSNGGNCVEVAGRRAGIAVRDSKNPEGGVLLLSGAAFRALTAGL